MTGNRPNLKDYSIETLRERFAREGFEPYRAEQIASWLYRRGVDDANAMSDLGRTLRAHLAEAWEARALEVEAVRCSSDGTRKAVLRARDGARLECVLIPEEDRTTLCVSSQVGCPLGCRFCASGALGFTRNLSTAEIVDQVCRAREVLGPQRQITNVVFMGMGEPLLNSATVVEAVRILLHPKGFAMAPRRVTVSTVGVAPKIEPLLRSVPVNLAVSLHATTDAIRDELVPLNRRIPLRVLLGTLRELDCITKQRPVFFEYALIAGVNDAAADARRLAPLLRGIPAKLNLIPINPCEGSPYAPPSEQAIDGFLREVVRGGLRVTLRRSRGCDIRAACGQLAPQPARDCAASGAGRDQATAHQGR